MSLLVCSKGSTLSLLLFIFIMDCLTEKIRRGSPWDMMFVDNVVSCIETREETERGLEKWRGIGGERYES